MKKAIKVLLCTLLLSLIIVPTTVSAEEVTEIKLSKTNIVLEEGKEEKITVIFTPSTITNEPINWETSDEEVAFVDDDGVVYGISEGEATITATTQNGKSATAKVTVYYNNKFKDVNKSDWYYETVKFVTLNEVMLGYNPTTFGPNNNITRGQLVTIIWRAECKRWPSDICKNAASLPNNYSDVDENYYTEAIKWATEEGVIHGYGGTNKFGPNDPIIRQDLAVILVNYYRELGDVPGEEIQSESTAYLSKFADYSLVKGTYAEQSLRWVVSMGIMNGKNIGGEKRALAGGDYTTRAEAAAMMMNFMHRFYGI